MEKSLNSEINMKLANVKFKTPPYKSSDYINEAKFQNNNQNVENF